MSDEVKKPAQPALMPKRVKVTLLRDGVWSETGEHGIGDTVEFDAEAAERLIALGFAKPAKAAP
jgi:hypothetical protein